MSQTILENFDELALRQEIISVAQRLHQRNMLAAADGNISYRLNNECILGEIIWSPENCMVYNPAFDVTPAELVSRYILDKGILSVQDLKISGCQPEFVPERSV